MRSITFCIALVVLLWAVPAQATIAFVQSANNRTPFGTSTSVTLTLTAGNAVLVTVTTSFHDLSPTQTAGDTLTAVQTLSPMQSGEGSLRQMVNYSVAGGSTTFTFTTGSNATCSLIVTEFSGLAASGLDQTATGAWHSAPGTTFESGTTATTTQANELLAASISTIGSGAVTYTNDNSFTIPTNGATVEAALAYRIVSATGAYTTTFTSSDNAGGRALISTFKASGGAASVHTRGRAF